MVYARLFNEIEYKTHISDTSLRVIAVAIRKSTRIHQYNIIIVAQLR